jgi:hypothetical protein
LKNLLPVIIYNALGEEVVVLIDKELTTITYEVEWNVICLPSGAHFYQLKSEEFIETKNLPALPTGRQGRQVGRIFYCLLIMSRYFLTLIINKCLLLAVNFHLLLVGNNTEFIYSLNRSYYARNTLSGG